jgi:hypothetical protein
VAAGTVTAFIGVSAGVSLASTSGGATAGPPATAAAQLPSARTTALPAAGQPAGAATAAPRQPAAGTSPAASVRAAAKRARAQRKRARQPYLIYDSLIPYEIPAGHIVATYADGPYPASAAEVAGAIRVFWIDIEATDTAAQVIDVEPGDASPLAAANWARVKLAADPAATAIIYTSRSEWGLVQAEVAALPAWMQKQIRWWIADPTGYPHIVPGSQATQWYWGPKYDISTALPGF